MRTHTKEFQASLTPPQAFQLLKDGNRRFVSNLRLNRNLLQQVNETSEEQYPFAIVLSCIDSRTGAELIFDQGLGIFSASASRATYSTKISSAAWKRRQHRSHRQPRPRRTERRSGGQRQWLGQAAMHIEGQLQSRAAVTAASGATRLRHAPTCRAKTSHLNRAAVAPCTLSHAAPYAPPSPALPRAERSHLRPLRSKPRGRRGGSRAA